VLALTASLAAGCEDKPTPTTTAPSAKPSATAAPKPTAAATATSSAEARTAKQGNMSHCPNAVEGASTEIKDTPDGVELLVTAKDEAGTKEIRARAQHLVDAAKAEGTAAPKHTGEGQGGGRFGRCPVVMKNTDVTAKEIAGGTQLTVKAKDAKEVDFLRREAKERQAELGEPGAKDAGPRKMANCPSAAHGATTVVKENKDGVEVTVTSQETPVTADIRERAKRILEAAKEDPSGVKHTGDGKGGGGLGRCPVVLKDTTVEGKDVPGGSTFVVKPKKAAELAALIKETKERAEAFAAAAAGAAGSAAPAASAAAPPKK
jgi:TusA-related sulfurtransferase